MTPTNITVIYHYLKTRMTESRDNAPEILAENFNEYKRILKIIWIKITLITLGIEYPQQSDGNERVKISLNNSIKNYTSIQT